MQEENRAGATNKADNLDQPTANDSGRIADGRAESAYPDGANESKGAGSPYGGTQTADAKAPDGNQQVNTGPTEDVAGRAELPEGSGAEYESKSSYGSKGSDKEGDASGEGDARGFVNH